MGNGRKWKRANCPFFNALAVKGTVYLYKLSDNIVWKPVHQVGKGSLAKQMLLRSLPTGFVYGREKEVSKSIHLKVSEIELIANILFLVHKTLQPIPKKLPF